MGVTASDAIRMAYVGGLAAMGACLIWIGATKSHPSTYNPFPISISLAHFEAPLPPTLSAISLPVVPVAPTAKAPQPSHRFVHFKGAIHGSLFESAMAQGVPVSELTEMIKAFSYDVDFQRDIQPDDEFELMYEHSPDRKIGNKLVFAKLVLSGDALTLYRYNEGYFTATGDSARKALLKTPVDGAKISSGFGRRFHPILHFTTQHKGVDFAVMTGTPVMAAGDGVVAMAGTNGSYGLYVRLKHDPAHATAYAHLSRLAPGVRPGKRVDQGQTIGYSGSTGRSTGPHLHYEVLVNEAQVNPMSVKFQAGHKLTGRELAKFQAMTRQVGAELAETPATTRTARAN